MQDKVKLPKEVAWQLKQKIEFYASEGMAYLMWECTESSNPITKWVDADRENIIKLSQAIVNGYEVEQSPEDKVREYYDQQNSVCTERMDTGADVIRKVLNLLDIKIGGVNA